MRSLCLSLFYKSLCSFLESVVRCHIVPLGIVEQEGESRVLSLFGLCHLFEFGSISGNKLGKFVNNVPEETKNV